MRDEAGGAIWALARLLGSATRAQVLLWLVAREESYAREIAAALGPALNVFQTQLARLEACGIVTSRRVGRVKMYRLDPACPVRSELEALLRRALEHLPAGERSRFRPARPPTRARDERYVIVRRYEE